MTSRERVMAALEMKPVDRVPLDLGGMNSTGISCFAYPGLVAALGLPPRRPRVHDTGQMLALPETDVLDALNCDVITVHADTCTNAFDEPERWSEYDFGGRLSAQVMHPENFKLLLDGSIRQGKDALMVPGSHVFDAPHGGQELNLTGDIPMEDLDALQEQLEKQRYTPERVAAIAAYCARVRAATDRAILFNGLSVGLGFRGGMANFSILCMTEPAYIHRLHRILLDHFHFQLEQLLPAISPYIDIVMLSADDQGTQASTILPPRLFRELFMPYYQEANQAIHRLAPGVKTFLHCCGAVYDILDAIIEAEFDVLNPVQWTAGGHSFRDWKEKCRGRIALWGGGVDTQATLPRGTIQEVQQQVEEVVSCLNEDTGFVFCGIHNLLAEVPADKIVTLYRTAFESSKI